MTESPSSPSPRYSPSSPSAPPSRSSASARPSASSAGRAPRRADARRSRAAVLDAAVRLLNESPEVSMEAVAAAAGVTRQTVYAHFPSRQRLLAAALDHATEEAVAAMDAVEPDRGPAGEALLRLLDASMETARRYPGLLQRVNAMPVSEREDAARHAPVTDRLRALVQRGQRDGEFDAALPPSWLVAVVISLSHASSAQVAAGHLSAAQAREALHISLLRVLAPASSRADPHRTGTGGRRR